MLERMQEALQRLRKERPVILNTTNYVSMDFLANCFLAIGASPIMSVSDLELEELIELSSAVYINIGTLDHLFIQRAYRTVDLAVRQNKPVIFDPVAAGATKIRTEVSHHLLAHATIVRGNASEILSFGDVTMKTRGVDSTHSTQDAKDVATALAKECLCGCAIAVSGAIDFITDGQRHTTVELGDPFMSYVVGMGCSLTGVFAAFRSVIDDSFEATKLGIEYFTLCGMLARERCEGPGLFKAYLLDELYASDFSRMRQYYDR
ncbi:hydroxyethylthiazole kinase [Chlamydia abortus]|uniref:Hydroxyethylthiazole kinase n=1 Tax=Chlamydia abortus (strain DSM 27085 / S26/3) TaxID=218497 RepID=THIM_CHLAB|nr:hydroxyethylthiazole kinase [Chlamydia abortus]Q5L6R4.1 RecName: Full=Hydroxyethylthiazole kinase; AltName: Full=4-methyl-5-beta-hydroxyethylthiazole kinase; Short=TH kinase; Short=Thz kinase [Chlamydia abortus S26/3]ASD30387.1 hydroxyethylthiazole kinase [Chlamydia abortus]AUS59639.1 hydroxyethylthiazole kinase [Chlamydia abortus]QRR31914.1 hydroxyethylthiazole kinase [Chlamydia abortus]CAH63657.1 putative hydroxyethylthiazole kinase [Chlamydia abortus S26/3]CED80262.1 putative hydroxyeth